ncbi:MAG: hypothetical protein Q8O89_03315 [Nanoarchaeota archaeon]|nr:hypothetical protein [Nanoarchaeota archaeon]
MKKLLLLLTIPLLMGASCSFNLGNDDSDKAKELEQKVSEKVTEQATTTDGITDNESTTIDLRGLKENSANKVTTLAPTPSPTPEPMPTPQTNQTDTGKRDDLIILYAKSIKIFEEYKDFFESNKSIVNTRISYINNRIGIFENASIPLFTSQEISEPELTNVNNYITTLNAIYSVYARMHKEEDLVVCNNIIDYTEGMISLINKQITSVEGFMNSYLSNPNAFVSEAKYTNEVNALNSLYSSFDGAKNSLNQSMDKLWQYDADYKVYDQQIFAKADALADYLSGELNQIKAYNSTSQNSYYALPQPSYNMPVFCTIDHSRFQSFVYCQ